MRARCPPSRGMCRIDPCFEWIVDFSRQSGKSVSAMTSMTPQAWFAASPSSLRPIDLRTRLAAPSQPITYFARTVRAVPSCSPAVPSSCTSTGYSPSSCTVRVSKLQPKSGSMRPGPRSAASAK